MVGVGSILKEIARSIYTNATTLERKLILSDTVPLTIGGRKVDVPKLTLLPAMSVMAILEESNSNKQFMMTLSALIKVLDSETAAEVEALGMDAAVALVTEWLSNSYPREEPDVIY